MPSLPYGCQSRSRSRWEAILRDMGSTPTKLINATYEYVLHHHALPVAEPEIPAEATVRVATPEMMAAINAMTLDPPAEFLDYMATERHIRYAEVQV